jgi:hypothetical protein
VEVIQDLRMLRFLPVVGSFSPVGQNDEQKKKHILLALFLSLPGLSVSQGRSHAMS